MQPARLPPSVKRVSDNRFVAGFNYAFAGILYATRTQRNMRFHLIAAAVVLFLSMYLRLERTYVALIVLTIVIVIATELMNTAIEAVVDLMTVAHHPLAKIAKDAAAGAVLVVAMGAVIVGYLAFYAGVTAAGAQVTAAIATVPRNLVIVTLAVTGVAAIFAKAYAGARGSPLQGGAVSGHAALAFAGATLIPLLGGAPLISLIGFFLAFLVSQSRVEGGIHTFVQVAIGAVLGSGISGALFLLTRSH